MEMRLGVPLIAVSVGCGNTSVVVGVTMVFVRFGSVVAAGKQNVRGHFV